MNKYSYKKIKRKNFKKIFRFISLGIFLIGILGIIYISLPLLSWQVYFAPVFAEQKINAPIPKMTIVSTSSIKSLISVASGNIAGVNYSNAQNWFPTYNPNLQKTPRVSSYTLSIPKLKIKDAIVTTIDNDLDKHLVNYGGTAVPPEKGNSVIYGHSTLPQLFNPKDYKTIFATAFFLKPNDEIFANVQGVIYSYKIFSITIVDPTDTSIFAQNYDDSLLTLVTCTPPGTTWKRLIIKGRLQKI